MAICWEPPIALHTHARRCRSNASIGGPPCSVVYLPVWFEGGPDEFDKGTAARDMNTKLVKLLAVSVSCSLVAGVPPGSRALQRGRRDDDDDDGWDWDDDFWDDDDYDYYYGISVDDGDRCAERDERCDDETACCGSDNCFWLEGKDHGECQRHCPEDPKFECFVPPCAGKGERCDDETACCAVWKSNIQPDFNVRII